MTQPRHPRPKRGRRALRSAASDLAYEWSMIRFSTNALMDALARTDQLAKNMALECFLVHARTIRDFFGSSGSRNDVLASDFLGRPIRVSLPLLRSHKMRDRLNKRVAHLSYSRSRLGRGFDILVLNREINSALVAFEARVRAANPQLADIVAKGAA